MKIELSGATIRPYRRGDESSLQASADDRAVWRNLRDMFPNPYTLQDAERWVSFNVESERVTNFAIVAGGGVIGGVGLVPGTDVHRHAAEIGYWLARTHWGRGIATEAVRAITSWGFDQLALDRIWAAVFQWNPASARVLEKSGYTREGTLRHYAFKDQTYVDGMLFARLRSDPPPAG